MSAIFDPTNSYREHAGAPVAASRLDRDQPQTQHDRWERERLLAAIVDEVAERGYEQTSAATVARRAGMTERDFYAHFADTEDCFVQGFDSLVGQVFAHTLSAYHAPHENWRTAVRAALSTLVHAVRLSTNAAQVYLVEAPGVGARALGHYRIAVALLEDAIGQMLADAPSGSEKATVDVGVVTAGVLRILEAQTREGCSIDADSVVDRTLDGVLAQVERQAVE
jgi:AcrR family transcriptional regulator